MVRPRTAAALVSTTDRSTVPSLLAGRDHGEKPAGARRAMERQLPLRISKVRPETASVQPEAGSPAGPAWMWPWHGAPEGAEGEGEAAEPPPNRPTAPQPATRAGRASRSGRGRTLRALEPITQAKRFIA